MSNEQQFFKVLSHKYDEDDSSLGAVMDSKDGRNEFSYLNSDHGSQS